MSNIKFKGAVIPIKITYKSAMFDFKELGLNLLNIFENEETIAKILTDDETMINVWWYYVSAHASTLDNALDDLTPEMMVEFREVFWEAVVNFINPQMRPALKEYMTLIQEQLASVGPNLRKALSDSSEEQE